MTYSEKVFPRVFALGLASFAVSTAFAFFGWRYEGADVGLYVGMLLLAIVFVVTASVFQSRLDLLEMGQAMHGRVGSDRLNGPASQTRLLNRMLQENELHLYCSHAFAAYLLDVLKIPVAAQAHLAPRMVVCGSGGELPSFRDRDKVRFAPRPIVANILLIKKPGAGAHAVVVCSEPLDRTSVWHYIIDADTAARFSVSCESLPTAVLGALADPAWILGELGRYERLWETQLSQGHVPATNKEQLGALQQQLTNGASSSVLGFDLTEIRLWYKGGRMEPVLRNNWKNAAAGIDVRRIFGFPSRSRLDTDEARLLAGVLRGHVKHNVRCGVVFENEWPDEKMSDFAVYDGRVAWVETARGREHVGGGYFTTNKREVERRLALFQEIWENTRMPVEDAAKEVMDRFPNADLDY